MRVSQVLHKMDRDEAVHIFDSTLPIDACSLYDGTVRGVHRDNPVLSRNVTMIMADGDVIVIDVGREERGKR